MIITFFIISNIFAQKEANIWYFGVHAGLDFNSGSPVAISGSQMGTLEGCATISNSNGELLFYTDGILVYDKSHNIMLNGNGLLGDSSSTQSAIIVPKPNTSNIYYIFTVDAVGNSNGFRYSEVDMNLNGGLGAITSNKNILLITPSCEKVTAVKKADSSGYWVITHGSGNNSFFAYSVSDTGINTAPVTSNIGSIVTNGGEMGSLKVSPDGSKLICLHSIVSSAPPYAVNVGLYDFNNQTGVVSNMIALESNGGYGAEFSPNGNIVYVASFSELFQYDLTAVDIESSKTVLYSKTDPMADSPSSLQLAPDGKIYCSMVYRNYIGVINNPDTYGTACNFVKDAVPLSPDVFCTYGLPQFIQSYFNVSFKASKLCFGDITEFSLNNNQPVSSIIWNFGDGSTSADLKPNHTYTAAGTYHVSVTASNNNGTSKNEKDITISKIPTANSPQDLLICDDNNDGYHSFDLTIQNAIILNGQDAALYKITYFANNTKIALPDKYINQTPYQQETITAEISNKNNAECKTAATFNIDVFDSPKPNLNVTDFVSCDNSSVGTDNDGRIVFDLKVKTNEILNGQSSSQFQILYFKDPALTKVIATPSMYQNNNSEEKIFVKILNIDNLVCTATTFFTIKVLPLPIVTSIIDLKQCDDDIDGFTIFNLDQAANKITTNSTAKKIVFFKTILDAQNNVNPIMNPTTYKNTIASSDKVYFRVTNNNNCYKTGQINLTVSTTQIPLNFTRVFTQCDDLKSGNDNDGISSFDFSSVTEQIENIFPTGQQLDITYYKNLNDALAEINNITDVSNYSNIDSPKQQKIFIRVDSRLNDECLGLGCHITLNVEPIPFVEALSYNHCDDDQDGNYPFDTSGVQSALLNSMTNVTLSYYDESDNILPSPLPNPFITKSQIIKVVAKNNSAGACSYESKILFTVDQLPQAFPILKSLTTACDDEADPLLQDGKYSFNTSNFQSTILGGQIGMEVHYYDENYSELPSPLPNPFITKSQTITVEVVNPGNSNCKSSSLISFKVNPIPNIQLTGNELVCSDLPSFTKKINAGLADDSEKNNYIYNWYLDGKLLTDKTDYELTVNKKGIYTVETMNSEGCSRTRTITVNASDKAQIEVNTVDLSEENTITVIATGAGDFVYALDDQDGYYDTNNIFVNVPAGIHTVFVKDLNGCGVTSKEVAILGIPKFFTPNQDGSNDTWNIRGVNASFNYNTIIQIFDRYGKLLKQINPLSDGWDGTFLNKQMPSDDYWYVIKLQDERIFKGHFALKR